MRRGEIWLVDLEPARGTEANKLRPAVLVSNDGANSRATQLGRGVLTVVPLTTNTARILPFQTFIEATESGLNFDSKAQAEQVRSVDVVRFGTQVGALTLGTMFELDEALRVHLSL